jgi:hypothetical protein
MDGKQSKACVRRVAAMAGISILAGACGAPPEDADDAAARSDTLASAGSLADPPATSANEGPSVPSVGGRLRAELEAQGGTDVTGTVTLSPVAGGAAVSVEIHGANSGLPYVAELVGGSCVSPSGVIAVLGQITAGEAGDGEVREVLGAELLDTGGASRIVRVRGAGDRAAIVACGNLGPG